MKTIFDGGTCSSIGGGESGVELTTSGYIDWGNKVGVVGGFVGGVVGADVVPVQAVDNNMAVQMKINHLVIKIENLHHFSLLNQIIIL